MRRGKGLLAIGISCCGFTFKIGLGLILALALVHLTADAASAAQTASFQVKSQEAQAQAQPEKIIGAPRNIKERTGIYVFLGWMWAAIGALIYFLRLKITEVDRLYASRFFAPDKK
ncbi:MAG: hypothetical protein AB1715_01495 [Acidobacteriota bacterium]